jgi:guanylate kinase
VKDRVLFDSAKEKEPLLIVISGHSAAGKDSVIHSLKERQQPLHFVVTVTSRPPREDEVHGVNYFFVSRAEFEQMIDRGEFIEHAQVYDDYKGVPRAQVEQALASGKDVIMRVDVQGAATIRELYPHAVLIFLTVQDEDELVRRLVGRKSETDDDLILRTKMAHDELERVGEFDYLVVNRDSHLDEAVGTVEAIIEAEHHRVPGIEAED